MPVAAFRARSGLSPTFTIAWNLKNAMAERKHPAICFVGNPYLASGEQSLSREDFLVVAPELPHGLARQLPACNPRKSS